MRVKMLKDARGSEHGTDVKLYKKDHVYNLKDELAKTFIDSKAAVESSEDASKSRPVDETRRNAARSAPPKGEQTGEADPNANVVSGEDERLKSLERRNARRENPDETQDDSNKPRGKALKNTDYDNKSKKGTTE